MILTPAQRARDARFRAMWGALATNAEIGAELGISPQTCADWSKRLGLPPRDKKAMAAARRPPALVERDRRIAAMWPDHTARDIGRALGVSHNVVGERAHRLGLPPKPSPILQVPSGKRRHVAKRRAPAPQVRKGGPVAPAPMVTLPPLASVTGSGHDNHAPDTRPPPSVQAPPVHGPGVVRAKWLLTREDWCPLCQAAAS